MQPDSAARSTAAPRGARVLCVDDDPYLLDMLRYALEREGFMVQTTRSAREAMRLIRARLPDLVVLDVTLPGVNGWQMLSWLRAFSRLPVVMLTARSHEEDVIAGFGRGADDYVVKPCSIQVLVQRIKAVLRRARPYPRSATTAGYRLQGAVFSPAKHEIVGHDVHIRLTPTESRILHLLLAHEGRAVAAAYILQHIQRHDAESHLNVVKTHIHNLRAKLGHLGPGPQPILTVRGVGYTLWQSDGKSEQRSTGS